MAIQGKVDTLKYWFLPRKARKILNQYQAPKVESAIAKQIPIKQEKSRLCKRICRSSIPISKMIGKFYKSML